MKTLINAFLPFILITVTIQAQDTAPELAPIMAKYEEAVITLSSQKTAAVQRTIQPYLDALNASERTVTNAGNLPAVAAINKEKNAVGSTMEPEFPADLPKALISQRKSCMEGLARIETSYQTNIKRIDAGYLKDLASLEARAARNPQLAEQVATQKQRLLAGVKGGAISKETLEKELIGHWYWGSEKLWVAITADGKAYLDTMVLIWSVEKDGKVLFVDTQNPKSKAVCEFDIESKSFVGTNFDGKPVEGKLRLKK